MGKLTIYKVGFSLEDNYEVDDIDTYLSTLTGTDVAFDTDKLNYLALSQNISVKLKVDQKYQMIALGNYAKLVQDDTNYYYFLTNATLIGKNTLAFTLSLDTINTFAKNIADSWDSRTLITRQHKDRYKLATNGHSVVCKVDRFNEGLNPALTKYKNRADLAINSLSNDTIEDPCLLFINNPSINSDTGANDAVKVGFTFKSAKNIAYNGLPAISNAAQSVNIYYNTIYFFTDSSVGTNASIKLSLTGSGESGSKTVTLDTAGSGTTAGGTLRMYAVYLDSNNSGIYTKTFYYTGSEYPYSIVGTDNWTLWTYTTGRYMTATLTNIRYCWSLPLNDINKAITNLDTIDLDLAHRYAVNAGTVSAAKLTQIQNIDRTNSKYSKISYIGNKTCPISITLSNNTISVAGFVFVPGYNMYIRSNTTDTSISQDFVQKNLSSFALTELNTDYDTSSAKPDIDTEYLQTDSKLLASEFYQYNIILDGDTVMLLKMEDCNALATSPQVSITKYLNFDTDTQLAYRLSASSNLSFEGTENPHSLIATASCQEVPLYTSSYLEYIRNGFNFDNRQYQTNLRNQKINAALNVAGTAYSLATGGMAVGGKWSKALVSTGKANMVAKAQEALQLAQDSYEINHRKFSNYKSRSRKGMSADEVESWNTMQRSYYSAYRQAEKSIPGLEAALDEANKLPSVNWNSESAAEALDSTGSYILDKGINGVSNTVSAFLNINSAQVNHQAGLSKLQYANNTTCTGGSLTLGNVTDSINSYRFVNIPDGDTIRHICDTFNWTGYACADNAIPNTKSRCRRNFLQCIPYFDDTKLNIYAAYEDDIKARYQAGVTYIHNVANYWDFSGKYENFESWLVA